MYGRRYALIQFGDELRVSIAHRLELTTLVDNMDFDGDATGIFLLLDEVMDHAMDDFQPHKNIFSKSAPRTLSDAAAIPKTVLINANNWYGYFTYGGQNGKVLYDPSKVDQSKMDEFLI